MRTPAPFLPANVDLRDFEFMPLDVQRLRDSKIAAKSTGEEFRAAVLLWCAAWHQVPAGSLPDDDTELAQLAGFGRVVKEWQKVRDGALHGLIKCADGRFWHPIVATKAADGWNGKLANRWKKECDRLRKANGDRKKEGLDPLPMPPKPDPITANIPAEVAKTATGIPAEKHAGSDGTGGSFRRKGEDVPTEIQRKSLLEGEGEGKKNNTSRPEPSSPKKDSGSIAGASAPPAAPSVVPIRPPSAAALLRQFGRPKERELTAEEKKDIWFQKLLPIAKRDHGEEWATRWMLAYDAEEPWAKREAENLNRVLRDEEALENAAIMDAEQGR